MIPVPREGFALKPPWFGFKKMFIRLNVFKTARGDRWFWSSNGGDLSNFSVTKTFKTNGERYTQVILDKYLRPI